MPWCAVGARGRADAHGWGTGAMPRANGRETQTRAAAVSGQQAVQKAMVWRFADSSSCFETTFNNNSGTLSNYFITPLLSLCTVP